MPSPPAIQETKIVNFRVPVADAKKFKEICKLQDLTQTEVLRAFVEDFIKRSPTFEVTGQ